VYIKSKPRKKLLFVSVYHLLILICISQFSGPKGSQLI